MNKICSFNIVVIHWLVDMWSYYVTNSVNKQTFYIYNFFRIMHSFPKTGEENC